MLSKMNYAGHQLWKYQLSISPVAADHVENHLEVEPLGVRVGHIFERSQCFHKRCPRELTRRAARKFYASISLHQPEQPRNFCRFAILARFGEEALDLAALFR